MTAKKKHTKTAPKSKDMNVQSAPSITGEKSTAPSTALTTLQIQAIEDSRAKSAAFEYVRYGFLLGAIGVLTPVGMTSEILDLQRIYLLPNTASWMQGLINLRGSLVPVIDLGDLLNVRGNTTDKEHSKTERNLLVIGGGEQAFAIIIDGLPQPVTADRQETSLPPIADYAKDFVIRSYSFQQRIWIDLDLETYLVSLRGQLAA